MHFPDVVIYFTNQAGDMTNKLMDQYSVTDFLLKLTRSEAVRVQSMERQSAVNFKFEMKREMMSLAKMTNNSCVLAYCMLEFLH